MCGIAGIVQFDDRPTPMGRVEAMRRHLRHRGPDGDGVSQHDRCALAHTRLSIIDLLSGSQPMHLPGLPNADGEPPPKHSSAGPLHLVFNGEIYNHRDLRQKLERRGHTFASDHSDTEVLLLGYRQWGDQLPKHLHGMFAFAIWDEQARTLLLARDRVGKKPLYFQQQGKTFAFASLVATLLAGDTAEPTIDPLAMLTFLRFGYPFAQSMIAGIEELPPAHCMTVDAKGRRQLDRYWRPPPVSRTSTALGAVDALEEVIDEAVRSRLEADVPLGCFLSGGIDSSIIAALGQRCLQQRGDGPLKTFSVAMPAIGYDESSHARTVAEHLGTEHTVLQAKADDAMADLERLMAVAGEPTADSSILPTHWLCRVTREHVKAALSGDGGDELFGGYDRYRALRLLATHRPWLRALPTSLLHTTNAKSRRTALRRLIEAGRAGASPATQYQQMVHLFTEAQIRELGMVGVSELASAGTPAVPDWTNEGDAVHAAMRWDLTHYLPFEVLRKVDRASMAVALEVRCPLLDTQVCDLAGHLPPRVLMPGGQPKGLLRQLARWYLPASIVGRRKQGFAVPIGNWFRTHLRDALADRLTAGDLSRLGVSETEARRYFDEHLAERADHTHRLFALLQLALWRRWLDAEKI
ncbi:asparagine synthase (glutamine-hydrolyzing) [Phycisphaerales bacterium AB-hyl4]|uniref:asparagine synthase (glutamine-hydrolyzing) n=1 Tax=Natronomicrosphaera hydrolytica TaxID=3242702 RepID=A0ABV4U7X8_9BACT